MIIEVELRLMKAYGIKINLGYSFYDSAVSEIDKFRVNRIGVWINSNLV